MAKTKKQEQDEAADNKAQREELARKSNQNHNNERIERMNAIADSADSFDEEKRTLTDVTDAMLADQEEEANRRVVEEEESDDEEGEEEDQDATLRTAQRAEEDNDEARDAGADEARKNADGVTEYKLTVNGKTRWATLAQIRASAQKVESADEYLQQAADSVRKSATRNSADDDAQALREADAETKARRDHIADLIRRSSMGDEEAIDALAEMQAGLSRVTPDVLRIVDERVDQRVEGRTSFAKAVEWFETEYAEELSSDRLKQYAAGRDAEMARESPTMAPRLRLKAVGDELRQLRKDLGAPPRTGVNKLERKSKVSQVPQAAGRQRPDVDVDEPETTQSAIAKMAEARGQGRSIQH